MNTRPIAAALAASVLLTATAFAQSTPTTSQPVQKPGLLSRMLHHTHIGTPASGSRTTTPNIRGMAGVTGTIVGNKKTLVYHMPTDHNLPSAKNRVYFRTVDQAVAAGYHAVGTPMKHATAKTSTAHGYHKPTAGVMGH